jgi:predicted DNA-binding transcriptional regulator AlpA
MSERKPRKKKEAPDGYLDEAGLAAKLKITVRTVWSWRAKRIGPPVTYIGTHIFWREAAVDQWLLKREEPEAA